jgi:hypothetical protein
LGKKAADLEGAGLRYWYCLFLFALMMGAGGFNLLHAFFGGILMFCLLYAFARCATKTGPQMLRF